MVAVAVCSAAGKACGEDEAPPLHNAAYDLRQLHGSQCWCVVFPFPHVMSMWYRACGIEVGRGLAGVVRATLVVATLSMHHRFTMWCMAYV